MIGFIGTSVTTSLDHTYYSAIADLHNLQFTVTHALGFSVVTTRLLIAELKQSHCD
jgi:redox-regulated HSP33 family molecular chaperone